MSPLAAASAALLVMGVATAARGALPAARVGPPAQQNRLSTALSTGLWTRCVSWWTTSSRARRLQVIAAGGCGLAGFALTRQPLVLAGLPALVIVLPPLLSAPANRDVAVLEALDRWVRLLIGSVSTGKSTADAIRATRAQLPPLLRAPVDAVIARLDARWTLDEALRAMADDLDSPDADAVVAALIVATRRGGVGSTDALRALGRHTRRRLAALREIEAERAKPRVVVRQVTAITVTVLAGVALVNPGYLAPYGSGAGQLVGALLLAAYLASLLMLRVVARPRHRERILQSAGGRRGR
ncbi:MAG: hypothetical protein E7Z97_01465 [Propionibacteriaceae bacterium]|nr:hypothetical protein [Propionibacteriaceae bacterium]